MGDPSHRVPAVLDNVHLSDPRELLLGYLDWYRDTVLRKIAGLSDEQLHSAVEPLGWSPLGLVQHLGWVERRWLRWGFAAEDVVAYLPDDPDDAEWRVPPERPAAEVIAAYRAEISHARAAIGDAGLDTPSRIGGRFATRDEAPTLGRILFHLLQEYARHAGHLDVARELIDGVTGE